MRIVLLGTEFSMTGAALLLARWAVHLVRQGHDVSAVHAPGAQGPLRDVYETSGVTLAERLEVTREATVICNTISAAPYVVKLAGVARTIWWLHEGESGLQILIDHPGAERAFGAASAIVFPSAAIRDRVYRSYLLGVSEQRQHIVPPGLPPLAEPPDTAPATGRPIRVICVGSIYPRKEQASLIRAVARLPDVPIECLMVGQPVMLDQEAVELTRRAPARYAFTGQVPHSDALRLIGRADILALPSESECLPLAPLEAGQRGKPVLLSDLPAHEGIWRHGVNCLMHPVRDVDLLAHSLRILAADAGLRARLGEAARQTAAAFRENLFLARLDMVLAGLS